MEKKGESDSIIIKIILSVFIIMATLNISYIKVNAGIKDESRGINLNDKPYGISNYKNSNKLLDNVIGALTGRLNGYAISLNDKVIGYVSLEDSINDIKDLVLEKLIKENKIERNLILEFQISNNLSIEENRFHVGLLQDKEKLASYIYELSKDESNNLELNLKYLVEEDLTIEPNINIIPTDSMYSGESKVEEGKPGLKKQVKEVSSNGNEIISSKVVKEDIILQQVNKKIYRGTKNPYDDGIAFLKGPTRGGDITSAYGERWNSFHKGIDIAGNIGDDVLVAIDGEVIYSEYNDGGYGNLIIVKHDNDMETYYAHLSDFYIKVGDKVKKGDIIGAIGNTGFSTGPHLHFELRVGDEPVNPINYIVQ